MLYTGLDLHKRFSFITAVDDFSHFILAWELKSDMAVSSLIDVVQKYMALMFSVLVQKS